jgi:hypothetical protein
MPPLHQSPAPRSAAGPRSARHGAGFRSAPAGRCDRSDSRAAGPAAPPPKADPRGCRPCRRGALPADGGRGHKGRAAAGAAGEGAGEPDRAGRWMPRWGAQGRCPSRFPYGFPSLHRHRARSGGGGSPLGAAVAARSLWRPLSPLPAGAAQRGPAAGAGAAGGPGRGGGVVGVSE